MKNVRCDKLKWREREKIKLNNIRQILEMYQFRQMSPCDYWIFRFIKEAITINTANSARMQTAPAFTRVYIRRPTWANLEISTILADVGNSMRIFKMLIRQSISEVFRLPVVVGNYSQDWKGAAK